jgi:hypothetical protein
MATHTRALRALCACTVILAAGTGSAAAVTVEHLVFMHPGAITATSTSPTTLNAGELNVRCNLTLQGTLNEETATRSGTSIGSISRATAGSCEGGERPSVTFLSLSWRWTYSSFSGTQPEAMTGLLATLNSVGVRISAGRLTCLYSGNVGARFALTEHNPYLVGTLSTLANSLSLVSGEGCARTGSITGSYRLSSTEYISEIQDLELMASPRTITRAQGMMPGGVTVTFTPSIQNVRPTGGMWRDGANGWMTNIMPCLILITYPSGQCQVVVTATAAAGTNLLLLRDITSTIVGQVAVAP